MSSYKIKPCALQATCLVWDGNESMYNQALIVAGGEMEDLWYIEKILPSYDMVIAADRGLEHLLKIGHTPKILIGDMDSCSPVIQSRLHNNSCRIIKLPCEKDMTDLEAALDYAVELGYKRIDVVAALAGERLDHLLGAVILLPKYVRRKLIVRLIGPYERLLQVIDTSISIHGTVGSYVSLLPLSADVRGLTTKGLKYPLNNATLEQGMTIGVSNELVRENAEISLKEGLLLVVKEANKTAARSF